MRWKSNMFPPGSACWVWPDAQIFWFGQPWHADTFPADSLWVPGQSKNIPCYMTYYKESSHANISRLILNIVLLVMKSLLATSCSSKKISCWSVKEIGGKWEMNTFNYCGYNELTRSYTGDKGFLKGMAKNSPNFQVVNLCCLHANIKLFIHRNSFLGLTFPSQLLTVESINRYQYRELSQISFNLMEIELAMHFQFDFSGYLHTA